MEPVVLFAVRDLPQFGILKGDRVVFDPSVSPFPSFSREIFNVGAVLGAFEAGDLISPTRSVRPADLRRVAGDDGPPPAPPAPVSPRARPHLTILP